MRLLLDTHVLLWAASQPDRLRAEALEILQNPEHEPAYSVAALWEIAVKNNTRRSLRLDPGHLRRRLLENGYEELPILAEHALAVSRLPRLHGDPFDRILIAQAMVEDRVLVTADRTILQYPLLQTIAV